MTKQDLIIYFILVIYAGHVRSVQYECPPGEIGQPNTLRFPLPNNETDASNDIIVQSDNVLRSLCTALTACTDYAPELYIIKYSTNNVTLENEIKITILNSSRINGHSWQLQNLNYTITCDVKVFSRANKIVCNLTLLTNNLFITCLAAHVYPEMKSHIYFEMQNVSKPSILKRSMNCFNTNFKKYPMYYDVKCNLNVSVKTFDPGIHHAVVTVYPNLTGDDRDVDFGTNTSFTLLTLDYPTVLLESCPEIVHESSDINCTCNRTDDDQFNVSIKWISYNCTRPVMGHSSQLILFNVQMSHPGYCCMAKNYLGLVHLNSEVNYTPLVIDKIQNLTCDITHVGKNVIVNCTAYDVYPVTHCNYQIKNNDTSQEYPVTNGLTENEKMTLNNQTYIKSTCIVDTTRMNLNECLYEIIISMYQIITLKDKSRQRSANKTATFSIDCSIWERSGLNLKKKYIVIISCTVVAFSASIALLSLCIIKYRAKEMHIYSTGNGSKFENGISNNEVEMNNTDIYSVDNGHEHDTYSRIDSFPRIFKFLPEEMSKSISERLMRYDVEGVVYTAVKKSNCKETSVSDETDIINDLLNLQEHFNVNRVDVNGCAYSLIKKPGQIPQTEINNPNWIEHDTGSILFTASEPASCGQITPPIFIDNDLEQSEWLNSQKRENLNQYVSLESLIKDTTYNNLKTKDKVNLTDELENGMTL